MLTSSIMDAKAIQFLDTARRFSGVRIGQPINMGYNGTSYHILYKSMMMNLVFNDGKISFRFLDKNSAIWAALTGDHNAPGRTVIASYDLSLTSLVRFRVAKTGRIRHLAAYTLSELPMVEAFFVATLSVIHDSL